MANHCIGRVALGESAQFCSEFRKVVSEIELPCRLGEDCDKCGCHVPLCLSMPSYCLSMPAKERCS